MTSEIINPQYFDKDGKLSLPPNMPPTEWAEVHRTLMEAKRLSKAWVRDSRTYGEKSYGVELVAKVEVQYELALGLEPDDDKPNVNPPGKASVFVSIEGINQQFTMWQRKMVDEIPQWDRHKLERAKSLLEPLAQQYSEIKRLIEENTPHA